MVLHLNPKDVRYERGGCGTNENSMEGGGTDKNTALRNVLVGAALGGCPACPVLEPPLTRSETK